MFRVLFLLQDVVYDMDSTSEFANDAGEGANSDSTRTGSAKSTSPRKKAVVAEVVLMGTLNGEPLQITRRKVSAMPLM